MYKRQALGFPLARANTVGYLIAGRSVPPARPGAVGYLYLPALVIVAAASVSMAPIGARVAHGTDVARLKRLFALSLIHISEPTRPY